MTACARGPPLRTTRPTHVADVRLADVEYVGAIGDSISTGFNARNQRPLDMLTSLGNLDDLGVAFSTGADADASRRVVGRPSYRRHQETSVQLIEFSS